jgi:hypothetical protein
MEILGILVILIGIPIIISGFIKGKKKEADYATRIRSMTDASLKWEIQNLAEQSRKLPLVIQRNSQLGTHAYYIKKNHEIAMAEFRRRGLKF